MAKPKFNDERMKEQGLRNLRDAASVLMDVRANTGADWWIEAGTFLGMIREGDLIGHDSDIDFGILGDEHLEEVKRRMVEEGFEIHHEFGSPGRGMEVSFTRGGVKVDVFCFYEEMMAHVIWMGCWRDGRMIRLEFRRDLILPAFQCVFAGVPVFAPITSDEYLTARYGDWRTPNAKWRWDRDPKCINWQKSEWTREELEEKYPWNL